MRIAPPLTGLALSPPAQGINEHPEQSAVVLGLALRNCDDVPISINLIPPRIIEGARRKQQYFYWAASLAVVLAIFATIIPDMQNKIEEVEEQTDLARSVIGKYDPKLVEDPNAPCQYDEQLNVAQNYIRIIKSGIDSIDNFYSRRRPWLEYLNALNDTRQRDPIWFTRVFSTTLSIDDGTPRGAGLGGDDGGGGRGGRGGRGLGGGLASAGARRPGATGAEGEEVVRRLVSAGFPGTTWEQARDGARGGGMGTSTGGLGLGSRGRSGRGGRGDGGETLADAFQQDAMPLPNGLEIHGYAPDEGVVLDYLDRLKQREEFITVYLDGRSVNPVPNNALGRSNTIGLPAAVAGSPTVVTFVLLVQVSGAPLEADEVGSTGRLAGMGTASGFGSTGGGMRGLRGADEDDGRRGGRGGRGLGSGGLFSRGRDRR